MKVEEGIALAAVGIGALIVLGLLFKGKESTTSQPPVQPPAANGSGACLW